MNDVKESLKDLKITSLETKLAKYKLLDLAQESLGMYPAAFNGKKRTAEMSGWNQALMAVTNVREVAEQLFERLTEDRKRDLTYLIINDVVELEVTTDAPSSMRPWINVNDIFAPAAEVQDIPWEEINLVVQCHEQFGHDGVLAYASHKKGARPWRWEKFAPAHPKFDEALTWIGRQH